MVIHGRKGTQIKGPGGQGSLPAPGGPHTCSQSLRFPDLCNQGCGEEGTLSIWKGVGGVDFSRWVGGVTSFPVEVRGTAAAQAPGGPRPSAAPPPRPLSPAPGGSGSLGRGRRDSAPRRHGNSGLGAGAMWRAGLG